VQAVDDHHASSWLTLRSPGWRNSAADGAGIDPAQTEGIPRLRPPFPLFVLLTALFAGAYEVHELSLTPEERAAEKAGLHLSDLREAEQQVAKLRSKIAQYPTRQRATAQANDACVERRGRATGDRQALASKGYAKGMPSVFASQRAWDEYDMGLPPSCGNDPEMREELAKAVEDLKGQKAIVREDIAEQKPNGYSNPSLEEEVAEAPPPAPKPGPTLAKAQAHTAKKS
jgi:hypothetical protein